MRSLEECKTEVFRRSEERIEERKRKRNRVLACCIPLCLLLVAGGIYIRPLFEPVDEIGGINAGPTPVSDRELGGMVGGTLGETGKYTSVEITDKTGSAAVFREVTDEKKIEELGDFMAIYFGVSTQQKDTIADEVSGKITDDGTEKENYIAGQDRDTSAYELRVKYKPDEKQADYMLVFRTADGDEFLFLLHDNYLYNEENGCMVTLSDTQLTALREQLEYAEENE